MGTQRTTEADVVSQRLWLPFDITMSAANTFTELDIATGVSSVGGFGLRVTDVIFDIADVITINAAGAHINLQVNREARTSLADITNPRLIGKTRLNWVGVSPAAGGSLVQLPLDLTLMEGEQLVVDDTLYVHMHTAGFTAALRAVGRIYYEQVSLTELDILRIRQA